MFGMEYLILGCQRNLYWIKITAHNKYGNDIKNNI